MESTNQEDTPQRIRTKKIVRSWFTKKLERKFEEKGLEAPQQLLSLLDVPFEEFTPEDKELYENEIKPLIFVFAEHLMEVYEVMDKPKRGWEEMLERIKPSPMKVLATLVIHEHEKVANLEDDFDEEDEDESALSAKEKYNVRSYNGKDKQKERWWDKKVF